MLGGARRLGRYGDDNVWLQCDQRLAGVQRIPDRRVAIASFAILIGCSAATTGTHHRPQAVSPPPILLLPVDTYNRCVSHRRRFAALGEAIGDV
jgi:hypothetical protein